MRENIGELMKAPYGDLRNTTQLVGRRVGLKLKLLKLTKI